jgi:hypothetical protein
LSQIAPESKEFLVSLFTELRDDLKSNRAIYDALLSGLAEDGELPGDETLREYVTGLAKATDEENRYEQAVLEHRAFAELARALGAPRSSTAIQGSCRRCPTTCAGSGR